jgi:hypothetical protein
MGEPSKNGEAQGVNKKASTSGGQKLVPWVSQWGFAVLVAAGVLVAGYVAWRVHVPSDVPDFALKAEAVYRVEVGAGTFLGLYLVMMAFVLALNNRGFSEIGVNGLKAQDMANKAQQDAIQGHEESLEILGGNLKRSLINLAIFPRFARKHRLSVYLASQRAVRAQYSHFRRYPT